MEIIRTVIQDGDIFYVKVEACGHATEKCENATVTFTIPAGIRLTGPVKEYGSSEIAVSTGVYNAASTSWLLGTLLPTECFATNFEFTVDDITQADPETDAFVITALLSSGCTDGSTDDNLLTITVNVRTNCSVEDLTIG